jgi:crotonobetainyl-CoA:carnitine CoA-transferase CaiB-like acyl-CoA transferase
MSGALGAIGREGEKPLPPLNAVGDFGSGGMMLAFGMVCALMHVQRGGSGQGIDCAMTDGSALLMAMVWGFRANGSWKEARGVNLLDNGPPFYDRYSPHRARQRIKGHQRSKEKSSFLKKRTERLLFLRRSHLSGHGPDL